jgi:hypothetical protein
MNKQTISAIRALIAVDPPSAKEAQAVADAIGLQVTQAPVDRVVRIADAAARLGVCKRSVRGYIVRGLLPTVKPAGNVRALGVLESALVRFMANGTAYEVTP